MPLGRTAQTAPDTRHQYPDVPTPNTVIAVSDTIHIARNTTEPDRPAVSSLELSSTPDDPENGATQLRQASKKPLQLETW
jgi:hypothetical protein